MPRRLLKRAMSISKKAPRKLRAGLRVANKRALSGLKKYPKTVIGGGVAAGAASHWSASRQRKKAKKKRNSRSRR